MHRIIIFILLIVLSCQKDWGNFSNEIYEPVDGPNYDIRVDYSVSLKSSKEELTCNDSAIITVKVKKCKINELNNDTLFVYENISDKCLIVWEFSVDLENRFQNLYHLGFTINGKFSCSGFGINSVRISTPVYWKLSKREQEIIDYFIKQVKVNCLVKEFESQTNYLRRSIVLDFYH